ncbi:MAG: hypothetical protein ABSD42_01885 [Candidatus Bathyarchaeia archaeon]
MSAESGNVSIAKITDVTTRVEISPATPLFSWMLRPQILNQQTTITG